MVVELVAVPLAVERTPEYEMLESGSSAKTIPVRAKRVAFHGKVPGPKSCLVKVKPASKLGLANPPRGSTKGSLSFPVRLPFFLFIRSRVAAAIAGGTAPVAARERSIKSWSAAISSGVFGGGGFATIVSGPVA